VAAMAWLVAVLGVAVQAILGGQVVIRLLHYWLPLFMPACTDRFCRCCSVSRCSPASVVVSDRPQLEDSGTPSIHSVAILNAAVIYLQ